MRQGARKSSLDVKVLARIGLSNQRPLHEYCPLTQVSRTFLKRKGGLFKKAHELSVLCSVDVAVIIFGHNKKLYEYSSGDINDTITRFSYVSLLVLAYQGFC